MFKDGKIFGKINVVDFFVVIIIILLVLGAVIKFGKYNSKTEESSNQTLEYKIEVKNIRDYTVNAIQSGDIVFDSQTGINIGKVINVESSNARTYESTYEGEIVSVISPYRYDLVITIETPGSVESDAYYANKTIELKVDSDKKIATKYIETTGRISEINIK